MVMNEHIISIYMDGYMDIKVLIVSLCCLMQEIIDLSLYVPPYFLLLLYAL